MNLEVSTLDWNDQILNLKSELDVHVIGEDLKLKVGIGIQNGDWKLDLENGVGK